jgi:sulfide:quinone oxidoreductase
VHTGGGGDLSYDALLVAVRAWESAPYEHAHVFTDRDPDQSFQGIVRDIELGDARSVAFVLPHGPVWPVPLYELALMTAERARGMSLDAQITFITPEGRPLKAFGQAAGDAIRLLGQAGIKLHTGAVARVPAPNLVTFGETRLEVERIVTLPRITGPAVAGLSAGTDWFLPVDRRCLVEDTNGRVFAAGDATDPGETRRYRRPAGRHRGRRHRTPRRLRASPSPFDPVIRGMLLTGDRPLYLSAQLIAGLGWRSEVYEQPPWPADEKVVAEELGPYLANLDAGRGSHR